MKFFFLAATVAMEAEKFSFSYFHDNHIRERNYFMKVMPFINPALPEKWSQTNYEFSGKVVKKVYI